MATPLETVMTMSEEELEVLNKKLKRQLIAKFVTNVAAGVLVHVTAQFLISALEQKKANAKELTD